MHVSLKVTFKTRNKSGCKNCLGIFCDIQFLLLHVESGMHVPVYMSAFMYFIGTIDHNIKNFQADICNRWADIPVQSIRVIKYRT